MPEKDVRTWRNSFGIAFKGLHWIMIWINRIFIEMFIEMNNIFMTDINYFIYYYQCILAKKNCTMGGKVDRNN